MLFRTLWPPEKVPSEAPQGVDMTGSGPGREVFALVQVLVPILIYHSGTQSN